MIRDIFTVFSLKWFSLDGYTEPNYEDITIPPNLNELLANLPDDVNADSLQKMFRDSVADRRALMQGFDYLMSQMSGKELTNESDKTSSNVRIPRPKLKRGDIIDKVQVSWHTERMADSPVFEKVDTVREMKTVPLAPVQYNAPTIAGQLIIYDLDEEPPISGQLRRDNGSSPTLSRMNSVAPYRNKCNDGFVARQRPQYSSTGMRQPSKQ